MELLKFLVNNWDTIGLLFTNIIALFMKSPMEAKK